MNYYLIKTVLFIMIDVFFFNLFLEFISSPSDYFVFFGVMGMALLVVLTRLAWIGVDRLFKRH